MIYFGYLFVLCLLLIWIYVLYISIGRRLWLSEPGWIWWGDFIIIMTCFFYIRKGSEKHRMHKHKHDVSSVNASYIIGYCESIREEVIPYFSVHGLYFSLDFVIMSEVEWHISIYVLVLCFLWICLSICW
jgi:hypothetical protein